MTDLRPTEMQNGQFFRDLMAEARIPYSRAAQPSADRPPAGGPRDWVTGSAGRSYCILVQNGSHEHESAKESPDKA